MTINEAIRKVVERVDLSAAEAESVLEQIMTGQCSDAQIGSLLTGLRMKGETAEEIIGFARVMRSKASSVRPRSVVASIGGTEREALIDTAAGRDGAAASMFNRDGVVVAGAGVVLPKHATALSRASAAAPTCRRAGR